MREYFPNAFIFGVDINSWNISQCRKKNRDPKIEFKMPNKIRQAGQARFDAIFCLAVLQDTRNKRDDVQDSSRIYPFKKFDAKLVELDGCLEKGGLFVIANSDYRFSDSSIFARYRPLENDHGEGNQRFFFGADNKKLPLQSSAVCIFVKEELIN